MSAHKTLKDFNELSVKPITLHECPVCFDVFPTYEEANHCLTNHKKEILETNISRLTKDQDLILINDCGEKVFITKNSLLNIRFVKWCTREAFDAFIEWYEWENFAQFRHIDKKDKGVISCCPLTGKWKTKEEIEEDKRDIESTLETMEKLYN